MRKTKERRQLDKYIDIYLDCDGEQTKEKNCNNCQTFFDTIKVVQKIREEGKEKTECTEI